MKQSNSTPCHPPVWVVFINLPSDNWDCAYLSRCQPLGTPAGPIYRLGITCLWTNSSAKEPAKKCCWFIGYLSLVIFNTLTHWGWVTHICISKLTIIGSDNGLAPERRQAIIWTNTGILLIGPLGTDFSEILSKIHIFSFQNMHLKMLSVKWRPFSLSLNVLRSCTDVIYASMKWLIIC